MTEKPLKNILIDWITKGKNKDQYFQAALRNKWEELVGKMIAQYTTSLTLNNRSLYLHISSAPLRKELSMGKAQIISIANEYLGEDYIKEVHIMG